MRTLYDAITPENIPKDAVMVAGYTSGNWPTFPRLRAMFPNAILVSIAINAQHDAQVLDVERGDALPTEAPSWCLRQLARGQTPTIYCNTSTWPSVRAAFDSAKLSYPLWWRADYNGHAKLEMGEIAHQYADPGPYDISVVADYWPGVDRGPAPSPAPDPKENAVLLFQDSTGIYFLTGAGTVHVPSVADVAVLRAAGVPFANPLSDTFGASLRGTA